MWLTYIILYPHLAISRIGGSLFSLQNFFCGLHMAMDLEKPLQVRCWSELETEPVWWGESQIQLLQQIHAERRNEAQGCGVEVVIQDWDSLIPCTFLVLWAMRPLLYSNSPNAVSATSSEQTWTYTEEEWGRLGQGIAKCNKYIQVEQTCKTRIRAKQGNLVGNFSSSYVRVCYRATSQKFTVSMRFWLMSRLPIVRHLGVEQLLILSFLYFARSYF